MTTLQKKTVDPTAHLSEEDVELIGKQLDEIRAEFLAAHKRTQNGREAMASRRAEFIAARDLTTMWEEFEDAKAEWAVEQEAAKAAQRERKSQKALKKREARRRKKEKDARAAAERAAEIQARWGVADKAEKENDDVWPTCEK